MFALPISSEDCQTFSFVRIECFLFKYSKHYQSCLIFHHLIRNMDTSSDQSLLRELTPQCIQLNIMMELEN